MRGYQALAALTVAGTYLLIVFGAIVRVTGSGLGCPDWPTCHGQFLPSLDTATRIEWFHRFLGVAGGLSGAALLIATLVAHRNDRRAVALVVTAAVLYVLQAVIGGVVVLL